MHMKNHVDQWCKEHCDPKKKPDLEKVIDYGHASILNLYTPIYR